MRVVSGLRGAVTRSLNAETPLGPTIRAVAPNLAKWQTSAAFVLGAGAVLGLPPFSFPPVLIVCFGGLFILLGRAERGRAFLIGWLFGLGFFLTGTYWIGESFLVDRDRFGWIMAVPAIGGLASFLALFPAVAATAYAMLRQRGINGAIALALLWTTAEWLRGHVLTGFPWNLIGYAWTDFSAPRQAAALVGVYGLSFVTVLVAVLPAVVMERTASHRHRTAAMAIFVVLLAALWIGGVLRLAGHDTSAATAMRIRVVQGNIDQAAKWDPEHRAETINQYLDLSAPGLNGYDVLLWPETAVPVLLDEDFALRGQLATLLPAATLLLTGVPRRSLDGGELAYWNSVLAIDSAGQVLTYYDKHHLVPFGEYVPFNDLLPFERLTEGVSDFSAGSGPATLHLPDTPPVGLAICYEAIFPGTIIDVQDRPAWIFNPTNDAWFGTSIGPYQHLAATRMRAVEQGLPVIRAANTGISAVIDAFGRVRASLPLEQTGVIDARLPPPLPPTIYAEHGDWMLALLFVVALVAYYTGSMLGPPLQQGNGGLRERTKESEA